jgi:hypothetical protein
MNRISSPSASSHLPSDLRSSTHQRLNMYALAAGAAGVGMLALTQPAEAKIIYTPANVTILGPHGSYRLDLNHDGVAEYTLGNTTFHNTDQHIWNLSETGVAGNAVVGTFIYRGFPESAHAFNKGDQIGPGLLFFQGPEKMVSFYSGGGGYSADGNWVNVRNRYLGLKFRIAGQTHYGWARFSVEVKTGPVRVIATLTGYAYESAADTAIVAGQTSAPGAEALNLPALNLPSREPAMLGLLATGAPALSVWRREEEAQ